MMPTLMAASAKLNTGSKNDACCPPSHGIHCGQVKKIKERGMDLEAFESYLMMHRYGMPPHGGLGMGLERLTCKLLDKENVRHTTLFPRDINRLLP